MKLRTSRTGVHVVALFAAAMTAVSLLGSFQAAWGQPIPDSKTKAPVVVELFTSQGCSFCPPADKFMMELAQEDHIIALTYPVDYWDHLGWKDTLATPANTRLQEKYNKYLRNRHKFTPQMIIDGRTYAVGSDRSAVWSKINARLQDPSPRVEISLTVENHILTVTAGAKPGGMEDGRANFFLVPYRTHKNIKIKRGANRRKIITYVNVIEEKSVIAEWGGAADEFSIDLRSYGNLDGVAVLLQVGTVGPILGAAKFQLTNGAE